MITAGHNIQLLATGRNRVLQQLDMQLTTGMQRQHLLLRCQHRAALNCQHVSMNKTLRDLKLTSQRAAISTELLLPFNTGYWPVKLPGQQPAQMAFSGTPFQHWQLAGRQLAGKSVNLLQLTSGNAISQPERHRL